MKTIPNYIKERLDRPLFATEMKALRIAAHIEKVPIIVQSYDLNDDQWSIVDDDLLERALKPTEAKQNK